MSLIAGLVVSSLALAMACWNLRLYRPAPPAPPSGPDRAEAVPQRVCVCVPARNEEANIGPCVRSLLDQRHAELIVLAYNDQSTDGTGQALARLAESDARLRVVPTEGLPEGWNGKQWACDRMARSAAAAGSEWLLFTDADVRFEPDAVAAALRAARSGPERLGLISTFPRQVTGTLAEALVVPLIHFVLLSYLPLARMRATRDPSASAGCGQFLLVLREAYLASGGHAGFRSSMHDGIRLPRAVRRAGYATDLFDGTALCSVRMYRGLGQVWRGFGKNAYEGLGSVTLLCVITAMHGLGHLWPWAAVALLGSGAVPAGGPTWWLAGAGVLVPMAERALLAARFGQPWLGVALHPLGVAMLTAIQWWSLWLHLRGRRAWKGRVGGRVTAEAAA
ncbi:MAG: glycosyl transferase [Isosphaera sp.]|nr:glycosyl transferase [Isosphaera sp.]